MASVRLRSAPLRLGTILISCASLRPFPSSPLSLICLLLCVLAHSSAPFVARSHLRRCFLVRGGFWIRFSCEIYHSRILHLLFLILFAFLVLLPSVTVTDLIHSSLSSTSLTAPPRPRRATGTTSLSTPSRALLLAALASPTSGAH